MADKKVYTVLKGDETVICIDGYVSFTVTPTLSHSKYKVADAEDFTAYIVKLLNDNK